MTTLSPPSPARPQCAAQNAHPRLALVGSHAHAAPRRRRAQKRKRKHGETQRAKRATRAPSDAEHRRRKTAHTARDEPSGAGQCARHNVHAASEDKENAAVPLPLPLPPPLPPQPPRAGAFTRAATAKWFAVLVVNSAQKTRPILRKTQCPRTLLATINAADGAVQKRRAGDAAGELHRGTRDERRAPSGENTAPQERDDGAKDDCGTAVPPSPSAAAAAAAAAATDSTTPACPDGTCSACSYEEHLSNLSFTIDAHPLYDQESRPGRKFALSPAHRCEVAANKTPGSRQCASPEVDQREHATCDGSRGNTTKACVCDDGGGGGGGGGACVHVPCCEKSQRVHASEGETLPCDNDDDDDDDDKWYARHSKYSIGQINGPFCAEHEVDRYISIWSSGNRGTISKAARGEVLARHFMLESYGDLATIFFNRHTYHYLKTRGS